MAQQWFYKKDGTKHGPVTSLQLKQLADSGELRPSDSVCREGRNEWKPAEAVKRLFAEESAPVASVPADVVSSPTPEATETGIAFGRVRSIASRLVAGAKSAALITAKQAEQAKIQGVSLPSAYAALGREVYAAGSLRDELQALFKEVDELEAKITDVEGRSKTRPKGDSFTDKAKAVGAAASDKAEAQGQRLRLSRAMAKLGQAAHELGGSGCSSATAVDRVVQLLKRTESLQSEIDKIEQQRGSTGGDSGRGSMLPTWIYSWPIVLSSLVVFPVGWALIWTHPRWRTLHKLLWTGASLLFIAALFNPPTTEQSNSVTNSSVSDYSQEGGITEDFFPHVPGTKLSYSAQLFQNGRAAATNRFFVEQKPDGEILEVESKVNPGISEVVVGRTTTRRRVKNGFIEIGDGENDADWIPELKLGAKVGDRWTSEGGETFVVKDATTFEGKRCVVIEKRFDVESPEGVPMKMQNIAYYAEGIGLVKWEGSVGMKNDGRMNLVLRKTIDRSSLPSTGLARTSGLKELADPYDAAYLLKLETSDGQTFESRPLEYLVLINGQNAVSGWVIDGEFKPENGFQITQASKQVFKEIDGRQIPIETPLIVLKDIFNVDDALAVQTWKKIVIYEFSNRSEARYSERTRMTDRTGRVTNRSPVLSDEEKKWSGSFERIK